MVKLCRIEEATPYYKPVPRKKKNKKHFSFKTVIGKLILTESWWPRKKSNWSEKYLEESCFAVGLLGQRIKGIDTHCNNETERGCHCQHRGPKVHRHAPEDNTLTHARALDRTTNVSAIATMLLLHLLLLSYLRYKTDQAPTSPRSPASRNALFPVCSPRCRTLPSGTAGPCSRSCRSDY